MLALVASPDAIHTKSKTAEGLQSASSERFERFAAPAAVILCNIHACSSHPWCPQWQLRVVIAFASSQWVEQYFFPAGAIHVQAICAHLVGAFDMVSSSRPIYLRCAEENSPNLSGQPSGLPKWQNSTLASQALARRFCTAPRLPCSSFWSGAPESPYLGSGTQSCIGGGQQKPITPNIAVIPSHSASAPFSFHAHLQTPNALIRSHIHRLVSSNCRAFSRLASVSFAPDNIRATSLSRSPSSILRMVVRVLPLFSVFSITKC